MARKPRLFWDTSALVDAVFAIDGSPYRDLFELAEASLIDMRISRDVLREAESVLRAGPRGDEKVSLLAIALSSADFGVAPEPCDETIAACEQITGYRKDARILAAAEECMADILVTHDRQHFIGNPLVSPPDTHCRARTADETLEWCLVRIAAEDA